MRLCMTTYYDGECVPILDGYPATIKNLVQTLQIDEKLLMKILRKYDAIFNHQRVDFYFTNPHRCEGFINSPELEPYRLMLELLGENI